MEQLEDNNNEHKLRREVIRQSGEHVPFMQVVLLNAIEDTRRAMANADDAGLSALNSLYCVLPKDIRAMFPDLPGEIIHQGRVRYYATSHLTRKKMTFGGDDVTLEYNPKSGKIEEKRSEPRTYNVPHRRTTTIHVENVTSRQVKRQFVMEWFTKILDVLEAEGLLEQSRVELIGGDDIP
jgi:hypothetical protein